MRRVRPRASRVLMALAVVLGVLTTLALRGHLARLEARASAAGPGEPVVMAARDLDRGTVLEAGMVETEQVPRRYRPPGALTAPAQAVGRTLEADVTAGEVLSAARLARAGGPVAALVPDGFRAVPVTAAIPREAVAPGDRVDVLATFATGQPHTETVVSGAEILVVLTGAGPEELGAGTTVVLLVTPDAAERLAYARAFADLSLSVMPATEAP